MKVFLRLLILGACILAVTNASQSPAPAKFAVEIPGPKGSPPSYVNLSGKGSSSSLLYAASLTRVTGRDLDRPQPTALKLDYKVEGEMVRITASVYFGEFDRRTTPVSVYELPAERVGTYSAGLEQSITLSEMAQFGLEPLTLKIVSAQPPISARPQTMSRAASIRLEIIGEDRTFYRLAVHNLSAKSVTAFRLGMPEKAGGQTQTVGNGSQDVIAPGGTYRGQFGIPHHGRMSNGKFAEDPPPPLLVVAAAVFSDGSYEGDLEPVAEIAGNRIGSAIQWNRVDQVMTAILADAQSDDTAKVVRLRSALAQLTEEPDQQMIDKVRSQFPGLSDEALQAVKFALRAGLRNTKESLTLSLNDFERNRARSAGYTLATWWSMRRKP